MKRQQLKKWIFFLCLLSLLVCCNDDNTAASTPTSPLAINTTSSGTLILGVISSDPADAIADKQPLVDYLASRLDTFGIETGLVKVVPDMESLGQLMADGQADLFMDSFYPAAVVSDLSAAVPIAYRQRDKPDKHAVFFSRADSGITTLTDLQGHIIVMEDFASTSGYLLPMFYLLEAGLNPVAKSGPEDTVAHDEIGYVFSGDDHSIMQWVLANRVIAGAAQDNTLSFYEIENPGLLVRILETETIMRDQPLLARADMDPALRQAITELLLSLTESEAGQVLLVELETTQFAQLTGEREADRARAQEMFELLYKR